MPPPPLSPRQRDALEILHRHQERAGRTPTGPELARLMGLTHPSTAYQHLRALEAKGYVEVVQRGASDPLQVRLLPPARRHLRQGWPRLGAVPAGPLDYEAGGDTGHVERVQDLLPGLQPGDYFLEADGDSMVGAGIHPGTWVLVRPGVEPRPGAVCAVWVEGSGGTLKRVYRDGPWVRLVAENPAHPERRVAASQVAVQGVVVHAFDVRSF
jgi:repressor LexA